MAVGLAVLDHAFLQPYDSVFGQLVLAVIVAIYAVGIFWLRKLARFDMPQRLLGRRSAARRPAAEPEPSPPGGRSTRDPGPGRRRALPGWPCSC